MFCRTVFTLLPKLQTLVLLFLLCFVALYLCCFPNSKPLFYYFFFVLQHCIYVASQTPNPCFTIFSSFCSTVFTLLPKLQTLVSLFLLCFVALYLHCFPNSKPLFYYFFFVLQHCIYVASQTPNPCFTIFSSFCSTVFTLLPKLQTLVLLFLLCFVALYLRCFPNSKPLFHYFFFVL